MPIPRSEKHFLETLAELLPGVRGYQDRESMRETDRRLREYLARRLDEGRRGLDDVRRAAIVAGDLGPLDVVGRLDRTLQKIAATLRYSESGYSGLFDSSKIGEREIERILAYDEALLAEVHAVADEVRAAAAHGPEGPLLEALERRATELDERVARRKELLDAPTA
jgi:hypothetical protein